MFFDEGLELDLNKIHSEKIKKYNLDIYHSGGGCFHVRAIIDDVEFLINPYVNDDCDHANVPTPKQRCIFGVHYIEGHGEVYDEYFFDNFDSGLKKLKSTASAMKSKYKTKEDL
mgnify:FL=1|tara:strand:+ start:6609 stop:6950 length:342 start_codon:yes stop_codon:yes gene_type:complete